MVYTGVALHELALEIANAGTDSSHNVPAIQLKDARYLAIIDFAAGTSTRDHFPNITQNRAVGSAQVLTHKPAAVELNFYFEAVPVGAYTLSQGTKGTFPLDSKPSCREFPLFF